MLDVQPDYSCLMLGVSRGAHDLIPLCLLTTHLIGVNGLKHSITKIACSRQAIPYTASQASAKAKSTNIVILAFHPPMKPIVFCQSKMRRFFFNIFCHETHQRD